MRYMFKKFFKKDIVTLKRYKPVFTTVDGKRHEGRTYNWAIEERVRCTIPQYIMIDIKSDGYIEDKEKIMYPLTNVLSIEWAVVGEVQLEDKFSEYSVFVCDIEEKE